eukprot:GEMP01027590.1.p1 GENE.GEMP01027590.1~~GEMP01027590.1.p1  ORF type:complete len:580 (+),score=128.08 GEMP01027590.1:58-1797(+)
MATPEAEVTPPVVPTPQLMPDSSVSDHNSDSESNGKPAAQAASSDGQAASSDAQSSDEDAEIDLHTPQEVRDFMSDFAICVRSQKLPALLDLYNTQFGKISDRYYKTAPWPSMNYSYAKEQFDKPALQLLYKELTYRHILTHLKATVEQRVDAWNNYYDLLQLILDKDLETPSVPGSIVLPPQWFWELLDEFVYHYQKFVVFRTKTLGASNAKSAEPRDEGKEPTEVELLQNYSAAWDTKKLMSLLQQLVEKSNVMLYLTRVREGKPKDGRDMPCDSARLVGYYSMVQLCRLHSLHGDYYSALQAIDMLDFKAPMPVYCTAASCHVSLFYYVGFAYLMMKRYYDATQTFSRILLYLAKSRSTAQYQDRMQEKCFNLLLVCVTLCPTGLDDQVSKLIAEKYSDMHHKLQASLASRDDDKLQAFEERFNYACPKFITPSAEGETENVSWTDAHHRQLGIFLNEVRQMKMLPTLTSYMKLYTTIPLAKLAKFCDIEVEALKQQMLALTHKTRQMVHPQDCNEGPLYGVEMNCGDIDFRIDEEKVHVKYIKEEKPYSQIFLKCIAQVQEIKKSMQMTDRQQYM